MLNSVLNSLNSVLTGGGPKKNDPAPPPPPKSPEQTATASQPTPGVVFDLSEEALKAVEASQAENEAGATSPAEPEKVTPFLPAAMAIAAEIAALEAQKTAAPAKASSSSPASEQPDAAGTAPHSARTELQADPDEEGRARAHAIQTQENGRLLSLVKTLEAAKPEPVQDKSTADQRVQEPTSIAASSARPAFA